MYYRLEAHQLPDDKEKEFGLSDVSALFDDYRNGIIINHPDNGILAGDRIRGRKNPHFKKGQEEGPSNQKYIYSLTDDLGAELSVRMAEKRRSEESDILTERFGLLTTIGLSLPQLEQASGTTRERYRQSLEHIVVHDGRVLNPEKKQARDDIKDALERFKERGFGTPAITRSRIIGALANTDHRLTDLAHQKIANRERQAGLEVEKRADQMVKQIFRILAHDHPVIAKDSGNFLLEAVRRTTKPGVLTVNNAWYHRSNPDSMANMVLAQDGWENLYAPLMRPMNILSSKTAEELKEQGIAVVFGKYALMLTSLEDLIDLSMVGGDYTSLAWQLQEQLFKVEELLVNARWEELPKAAARYKDLLRYRVMPGGEVPEQWYSGLPGIKSGKEPYKSKTKRTDPFQGLAPPLGTI